MSVEALKSRPAPERRQDVRRVVHERYHVQVQELNPIDAASVEPLEGIVTDFGTNGIGMILDRSLKAGAEVLITIQGKDLQGSLHGRVIWCNTLPSAGKVLKLSPCSWRAGFEFNAESQEEADLIASIFKAQD